MNLHPYNVDAADATGRTPLIVAAAGGAAAAVRALLDAGADPEVGRCKLDPGLKAPPVSKFDCDKDNTAFNLNLVSELAPLHWGGGR